MSIDREGPELLPLKLSQPQVWVGEQQRPIVGPYSRVMISHRDQPSITLLSIDGTKTLVQSNSDIYIDLQVLLQSEKPDTYKPRQRNKALKKGFIQHRPSDGSNITYFPQLNYDTQQPSRPTLRILGIPHALSRDILDKNGKKIGCVTLGKELTEKGITTLETNNLGIKTPYPTDQILYIHHSFINREYVIVFYDEENRIQTATRRI